MASIENATPRQTRLMGPGVLAVCLSGIVLAPVIAIIWIAFNPTENIWPHLWATTLPRYLFNTVLLLVCVGTLSAFVGSTCAWLVTIYRFPGRNWLQWALFAPLAVPAYVGAYAITDFLEYAGPIQTGLRGLFGWENAADYWFFDIRTRGAAVIVLASVLYPYVYLLTRAALREQSGAVYEVARALGTGGVALFLKVGIPLARPAIAVGAAISMMETVADFGVVDFFAVQTLTTGIFTVWLEQTNAGGAAQIALFALGLILILVTIERFSRRKMRFHQTGRQQRRITPLALHGAAGWTAFAFCLVPVLVGFVLPVGVMLGHAVSQPAEWADPKLMRSLVRTVFLAGTVAIVTTGVAVALVYSTRLTKERWPRLLLPVTSIGYAMPGAVLGIGVLIPLAALDHRLADTIWAVTGADPGLLLTGTGFAVIFACCVRFFAIAQGATDSAMGRVAPSLPMAARSLGRTSHGTLTSVYLPLIRPSVGTALLLVFVDTVKELPMTLFLRPFNFETLATRVYERASLEKIAEAAPPALVVCLVGLCAVGLITRANR